MHPAQKHAVLAMIASLEHMLYNIKQVLEVAGADPTVPPPHVTYGQEQTLPSDHLSDAEEAKLEQMMEKERQRLLAEHEKQVQQGWQAANGV